MTIQATKTNREYSTIKCNNFCLEEDGFCNLCGMYHYTVNRNNGEATHHKNGLPVVDDGYAIETDTMFEGTKITAQTTNFQYEDDDTDYDLPKKGRNHVVYSVVI